MRVAVYITHREVPGWDFDPSQASLLENLVPGLKAAVCRGSTEFLAALPEAAIAMVWGFRQEWLERAASLRLLVTPAAGRDYFDVSLPATVEVSYGRFHGTIMAETVVGMLLGMCRGILPAADVQRTAAWPRAELAARMRQLRGAHVVVLGFGRIGQAIARLLKAFGARVTGIRRQPMPAPAFLDGQDRVGLPAELDSILPDAEHLVVCLPATPETDLLLDRRRLALLPARATVCNVGRGNVLDESALMDALRNGRLAGACLDVFGNEPLPLSSPLRACPNLWLMPHASAIAPNYLDLFVSEFAERWRDGEFALSRETR